MHQRTTRRMSGGEMASVLKAANVGGSEFIDAIADLIDGTDNEVNSMFHLMDQACAVVQGKWLEQEEWMQSFPYPTCPDRVSAWDVVLGWGRTSMRLRLEGRDYHGHQQWTLTVDVPSEVEEGLEHPRMRAIMQDLA